MNEQSRPQPGRLLAGFVLLLVMVGFVLGTATLLGPVRWMTTELRSAGASQAMENGLVIAVIVAYLAVSVIVTRVLIRRALHGSRTMRLGIPVVVVLLTAVALWGWMTPSAMASGDVGLETVSSESGAHFVFGPYPEEDRLRELKKAGYAGVISLLHPAVVPFEPKLLKDEVRNTGEVGLELIHAPMLPWVASNDASLAAIRELAESGEGTYYVHCYLGRDRVNVAKRVIESAGVAASGAADLQEARGFEERDEPFERGALAELESDVWLVPYPNEHEMFGYILFGTVGHALLLLDPDDEEQARWIRESTDLMREYAVPFTHEPLRADDAQAATRIAQMVRTLPQPVAVIVPRTAPQPGTDIADAFTRAWRQLPSIR